MSENVKVVSNFLAYDTEGNVTGIAGDMVHIFNKNESAVHDSPYFKKLEGRKNIVLMGDSLGDLQVIRSYGTFYVAISRNTNCSADDGLYILMSGLFRWLKESLTKRLCSR